MASETGLRERKKQETKHNIASVATRLFAERGFDDVTVAEVAAEASVSPATVFNYFPKKEDLVLDHREQLDEEMLVALRDRPRGQSLLEAARRHCIELAGRIGNVPAERRANFRKVFAKTPAVQARFREIAQRHEAALAAVLAEETGAPADAIEPRVAAALLTAVTHMAFGLAATKARAAAVQDLERAFDLLAKGLGDYR